MTAIRNNKKWIENDVMFVLFCLSALGEPDVVEAFMIFMANVSTTTSGGRGDLCLLLVVVFIGGWGSSLSTGKQADVITTRANVMMNAFQCILFALDVSLEWNH